MFAAALFFWSAAPRAQGASSRAAGHINVSVPPGVKARYRRCQSGYRIAYRGPRIGCYHRGRKLLKPRCAAGYYHPAGHFSCERRRAAAKPAPVATTGPPSATPVPKPAPGPAPAPTPAPSPVAARNQQMLNTAVDWGIHVRAIQLINGTAGIPDSQFYYGEILPWECVVVNPGVGRCILYMWWEGHDLSAIDLHTTTTREIHRTSIFAQDLGTAVGFQMSSEPQGILGYDFNRPWYLICSDYFVGTPVCPANRLPPTPLPAHPAP